MKTKEVKQYECDYCSKKLLHKGYMERHENECHRSPTNKRPCFGCVNLDRVKIEYDTGRDTYHGAEPIYKESETFYCKAKDMLLISPQIRFKDKRSQGNIDWVMFKGDEVEQFDMPLECEDFKDIANDFLGF